MCATSDGGGATPWPSFFASERFTGTRRRRLSMRQPSHFRTAPCLEPFSCRLGVKPRRSPHLGRPPTSASPVGDHWAQLVHRPILGRRRQSAPGSTSTTPHLGPMRLDDCCQLCTSPSTTTSGSPFARRLAIPFVVRPRTLGVNFLQPEYRSVEVACFGSRCVVARPNGACCGVQATSGHDLAERRTFGQATLWLGCTGDRGTNE